MKEKINGFKPSEISPKEIIQRGALVLLLSFAAAGAGVKVGRELGNNTSPSNMVTVQSSYDYDKDPSNILADFEVVTIKPPGCGDCAGLLDPNSPINLR